MPPGVLLEVDTVSVEVPGAVPLIVTGDGLKEQVGAGDATADAAARKADAAGIPICRSHRDGRKWTRFLR